MHQSTVHFRSHSRPTLLLLLLGVLSLPANAEQSVPYTGTLEQNGVPANGTFALTFRLHSTPQADTVLYEESQSVVVFSGRFSTLIGPIPNAVFNARPYLEIAVDGQTLAGRTALRPVPFAIAGEPGTPFVADRVEAPVVQADQLLATQLIFPDAAGLKILFGGASDPASVTAQPNDLQFRGGDATGGFSFGPTGGDSAFQINNDGTLHHTRLSPVIDYGPHGSDIRIGTMSYGGGKLLVQAKASAFRANAGDVRFNLDINDGSATRSLTFQSYTNQGVSHKEAAGVFVIDAGFFAAGTLTVSLVKAPGLGLSTNSSDFSHVTITELPAR